MGITEAVNDLMGWGELIALTRVLGADPTSHLHAAVTGWRHPWSREAFILADLVDAFIKANSTTNIAPYPRPTDQRKRKGASLTPAEFRRLWAEANQNPVSVEVKQ